MKKVKVNAGICGLETIITAESEDGAEVTLNIVSECPHIKKFVETIGDTVDSYEVCFAKPNANPLYENFEGHAACPVIAGIIKSIEAECSLALPKNAEITFID